MKGHKGMMVKGIESARVKFGGVYMIHITPHVLYVRGGGDTPTLHPLLWKGCEGWAQRVQRLGVKGTKAGYERHKGCKAGWKGVQRVQRHKKLGFPTFMAFVPFTTFTPFLRPLYPRATW